MLEAPRRQETGQRVRDRPFGPGLRAARVLDRQGDVERELPEALDVEPAQPRRRLAPAPGRGQKDAEHARDLLVDPDRYECVGCDAVLLHDASQLIGSQTRGAELPPRFDGPPRQGRLEFKRALSLGLEPLEGTPEQEAASLSSDPHRVEAGREQGAQGAQDLAQERFHVVGEHDAGGDVREIPQERAPVAQLRFVRLTLDRSREELGHPRGEPLELLLVRRRAADALEREQPERARAHERREHEIGKRLACVRLERPPGPGGEEIGPVLREGSREEAMVEGQLSLLTVAPRRGDRAKAIERLVGEVNLDGIGGQELREPPGHHAEPLGQVEALAAEGDFDLTPRAKLEGVPLAPRDTDRPVQDS